MGEMFEGGHVVSIVVAFQPRDEVNLVSHFKSNCYISSQSNHQIRSKDVLVRSLLLKPSLFSFKGTSSSLPSSAEFRRGFFRNKDIYGSYDICSDHYFELPLLRSTRGFYSVAQRKLQASNLDLKLSSILKCANISLAFIFYRSAYFQFSNVFIAVLASFLSIALFNMSILV